MLYAKQLTDARNEFEMRVGNQFPYSKEVIAECKFLLQCDGHELDMALSILDRKQIMFRKTMWFSGDDAITILLNW